MIDEYIAGNLPALAREVKLWQATERLPNDGPLREMLRRAKAAGMTFDQAEDAFNRLLLDHAMSRWSPIDVAPRDGRTLLLWVNGHVDVGFWHDGSGCQQAGPGWFFEADRGHMDVAHNCAPTHWQPLPGGPSQ
jgi:hypothetical protein